MTWLTSGRLPSKRQTRLVAPKLLSMFWLACCLAAESVKSGNSMGLVEAALVDL